MTSLGCAQANCSHWLKLITQPRRVWLRGTHRDSAQCEGTNHCGGNLVLPYPDNGLGGSGAHV